MLRATVVAKTDICRFTERVSTLSEQDLGRLLSQHKHLVSEIMSRGEGSIVKGEGDSFWAIFPSVTRAAQASLELHRELRVAQAGLLDQARVAIRVAIALGDVLHQDNDIFGDAVNLAARIESVTPPDEIYLSQAAWLALNKSEVQTSFVEQLYLKGIAQPEQIYKVEHKLRIHPLVQQVVVLSDISGFHGYLKNHSLEEVEQVLLGFRQIVEKTSDEMGGLVRGYHGDSCLVTFPEAVPALRAVEALTLQWESFVAKNAISCHLRTCVHKGNSYLYGSFVFGDAIDATYHFLALSRRLIPTKDENVTVVTGTVRDSVDEAAHGWKMTSLQGDTEIILFRFTSL